MREFARSNAPSWGVWVLLVTWGTSAACGAHEENTSADLEELAGTVTHTARAVSAGEVDLSWTTTFVSGITRFVVQRGPSTSALADVTSLPTSTTTYADKAVAAG